ncbi:hypothetical protein RND81_01G145100 [Saponaria officinalis]|uniref:Pectinesterase n=1 Tax=Saponaria officinalis TaxID=3572 RepID=A0AAW1NFS0_SAPOF
MCGMTRFSGTCVRTLAQRLGSSMIQLDKVGVTTTSLDVLEDRLMYVMAHLRNEIRGVNGVVDSLQWAAYDDCIGLYQDSIELLTLARSLLHAPIQSKNSKDLMTWMTTTCSNHDTCMDGFKEANEPKTSKTAQLLSDLTQTISNHIVLSSLLVNTTAHDRRSEPTLTRSYPKWLSKEKQELLDVSIIGDMPVYITVSQDGIGTNLTVKTIAEAIQLAPNKSSDPIIIYVKTGRYQEPNLIVRKGKTNLWFIGDGKGKTIITGNISCRLNKTTTFKTSSFGAIGNGFVARGITFENTAGPENHQAVALLVKSDKSVLHDCEMKGYQDTLYTHSNRQFYRDCDIYGTVDFIFGNAQVVFQNCSIYALKPMLHQNNTITAQKRSCPSSISGISIHESRVLAASDLEPFKYNYSTYLGRPWRPLSTVVYMSSYIGDHVHPQGWIPWNETSTLDLVYYGEFMNYGPGADTNCRVQSPGIHPNMTSDEAIRFTVDQFIDGSSWIAPTNVPFELGLGNLTQH